MSTAAKAPSPKPAPSAEAADDVPPAPPPPRPGLLPTGLSRAIVIATVIVCVTAAPFFFVRRYELVAATRSENALVFRLDTLSGAVSLCSAVQCAPVSEK